MISKIIDEKDISQVLFYKNNNVELLFKLVDFLNNNINTNKIITLKRLVSDDEFNKLDIKLFNEKTHRYFRAYEQMFEMILIEELNINYAETIEKVKKCNEECKVTDIGEKEYEDGYGWRRAVILIKNEKDVYYEYKRIMDDLYKDTIIYFFIKFDKMTNKYGLFYYYDIDLIIRKQDERHNNKQS